MRKQNVLQRKLQSRYWIFQEHLHVPRKIFLNGIWEHESMNKVEDEMIFTCRVFQFQSRHHLLGARPSLSNHHGWRPMKDVAPALQRPLRSTLKPGPVNTPKKEHRLCKAHTPELYSFWALQTSSSARAPISAQWTPCRITGSFSGCFHFKWAQLKQHFLSSYKVPGSILRPLRGMIQREKLKYLRTGLFIPLLCSTNIRDGSRK